MERNNRFNDNSAKLNAFLYSKKSIKMDGNESNIKINGGISAPRIVLNSIRERSYAGRKPEFSGTQIVGGRAYEGWEEQKERDAESRLQIEYNEEIFNEYSDLTLEDRIKHVPPAKRTDIEK